MPVTRDKTAESGTRLLPVCVQPTPGFGKMQVAQLQQECTRLEHLVEDLDRQLVTRTGRQTGSQDRTSSEQQHLSASGAQVTDSIEGSQSPSVVKSYWNSETTYAIEVAIEQEHNHALQQLTCA